MKNNKLLKYIGIAAAVLILFVIVGKKAGWLGKKEVQQVATEKVETRTIVETVSANGKVQPEVEVKISPDVSGEIVEMYIKEGDPVKKGQLLAKINPNIYASTMDRMVASLNTTKANLANSQARLVQSESQYEKARATYERNKKLADDGTISPSDFESMKSAYEVAKADVDAAKQSVVANDYGVKSAAASVKESSDNLQKTSIIAPVDGTVSKLNVEKGERVVGTSQMAGTEMMRIANLNEMEVTVDVNENDIVRVHLGDTALVEIDSYLNRKFKGIVTEIGNSANSSTATSVDQVTNFTVKIRIVRDSYKDLLPKDKPNQSPFRPGMSATVDIQTKRTVDVLSVPIQAVTTRDTSAKMEQRIKKAETNKTDEEAAKAKKTEKVTECIFVLTDGKVKMRTVTTGIQDNSYIEILTGLKKGDEVVSGPYSAIAKKLKDGDKVNVVPKEQLFSNKEEDK
jgi:HlyD family secretion protein